MSKIVLTLVLVVAYGLGYMGFISFLGGIRGGHEYFRTQRSLERLQSMTKGYLEEHGSLPDIEGFNALLRERWKLGRDHAPIEVGDDGIECHLNFIIENAIRNDQHLWNSPPHFVLTSANSDGFGFYLDGQDGTSKTKGLDRDDINSWDRSSIDFYHERRRHRLLLMAHTAGAALALGAFTIHFGCTRKRKPNKPAHPTAVNASI